MPEMENGPKGAILPLPALLRVLHARHRPFQLQPFVSNARPGTISPDAPFYATQFATAPPWPKATMPGAARWRTPGFLQKDLSVRLFTQKRRDLQPVHSTFLQG